MSAQTHLVGPAQFITQYEDPSTLRLPCSPPSSLSLHDERLIQAFSELRCSALQDPNLQLTEKFYRLCHGEASLSTVKTDDCAQVYSAGFEHSSCTPYHRSHKPSDKYSDVGGPRFRRSVASRNVLIKPRPKKSEKRSAHCYVLARQVRERHGANIAHLSHPEEQAPIANIPHCQPIRHLPSACPTPDAECHDDVHKCLRSPSALQITPSASDGLIIPGNINAPSASLSAPFLKLAPLRTFLEDASQRDNDNCCVGNQPLAFSRHLEHRNSRRPSTQVSGSNKLIKRHSIKRAADASLPFPASALSDLSPVPLSSIAIANAKLRLEPATPVSLSEYLTDIQNGHRVSTNESMTDTLPARRSKSFKFPSYQTWKTRRINIFSSNSTSFVSESGHHHSSTDALASLAWSSVVPSSPPVAVAQPCSETAKHPTPDKLDPKEVKPRKGIELKREWAFAMALTDDDVTDEVIVEELEKLRTEHQVDYRHSLPLGHHSSHGDSERLVHSRAMSTPNMSGMVSHPHVPVKAYTVDVNDPEDAATWRIARSALFCCREIVKTERRYQEELKALIDGETTTPPPALMLKHLPALLHASQVLLQGLSEDPSIWGVSAAFMACEDEMETAMVAWCKVAGQFFQEGKSKTWRRKSQSSPSSPSASSRTRTRSFSTGGDGMITFPPWANDKSKEDKIEVHQCNADPEGSVESTQNADEKTSEKCRRTERRLSVRDLAIQPTQRVMRYVMLYRDLLAHTPKTSPSRALVERALQAAQRIADKCNSAQSNTAFLPRRPTIATGDSPGPLRSLMSSSRTHQES